MTCIDHEWELRKRGQCTDIEIGTVTVNSPRPRGQS